MNLLIFGSSITWGAWDQEGGWAQRLKSFCDAKAVDANFESYTSVYCLGVSGDKTTDLLERFDTEVKARIDEEEKTLILIEIGINDSQFVLEKGKHRVSLEEYKQNLLTLINKAKQYGSDLILIGLTPVDDGKVDPTPWTPGKSYRLEFVKQYEEILKEVSQEQNILCIEIMDKFQEQDYKNLFVDGLHPNTQGHQIIYEQVKTYLINKGIL